jgi:hypothetical protein
MTFVWKDPVTWQPLVRKTRGVRQTQRSMLLALRATYDSVLVFHGGRPLDVESYYKYGLRIADKQQLTAAAKRIFLSPEFPEINEDAFQEAVSMLSGIHDRVLFVVLDDRELAAQGRFRAVGLGQQGDGMDQAHRDFLPADAVGDVGQAAGIAGRHDGGFGGDDVLELAVQQLIGHLRLDQIVDARAAAAPSALRQLRQCELGNGAQNLARLRGDLLAVAQMAGFVVSDVLRGRARLGRREADLRQPFVDVLEFRVPQFGAFLR